MKNFNTYVQEANLLCELLLKEKDVEATTKKLIHMQEKINQSELTVYQKYFLLLQLSTKREAAYM